MKKILFLLLLSVAMYGQVPADATPLENIQITNNAQDNLATKVAVQTNDGVINWKYIADIDVKTKARLSTGLLKNGLISANGDPTKFNITAGIGIISNFDDPENPTSTIINFPAFTGITPTYLLTGTITYVAINSTPAVVMQATPFTPEQRRSLITLGAVIHSNLTTINILNNISAPTNAGTNQLHDFIEAVGALNITGNKYTANGANLQLNKSAGLIFKLGSNFANDWKNPHELAQSAMTSLTFRYRTQNGTEGSDRINLDPSLYDLNNVLTAVPNNKFTIQTVTMFQSGLTRIQYGQNVYDDLATAKNAVFIRNFVLEPNSKENGIIRAYIIMRNTTTSLQTVADADILEAQKFGGVASGGVALTLANIVTALGYTPENVANKQNSLAFDGTGLKYPTVDATSAGLATKPSFIPIETVTPTVGGYATRIAYPQGTNAQTGTPLVIFFHGYGADQNAAFTGAYQKTVTDQLLQNGYMVASTLGAGDSWGNQASVNAYKALYDHCTSVYNISKIFFWAESMGGLVSLNLLSSTTLPQFDGWYGTYPATNLQKMYDNVNFSISIETAYGFSFPNFATATAGYDPNLKPASSFPFTRYKMTASNTDTAVLKSENTDLFYAKMLGNSIEDVVLLTLGAHGDASNFISGDLLRFASHTFIKTVTEPSLIISGETASTIASFDSKNYVRSLSTATYPSLTELSYVKGLSSGLQPQINLKANLANPTFTGTVSGITKTMVGLSNVDNTTDLNKPVSTATQTALNLKANLASPTFTGTVSGITKTMVGLSNVDNTTDLNKPVSTATQTALNLKANLASPTFTGLVNSARISATGTGNDYNTGGVNVVGNGALNTIFPTVGFGQPGLYGASIQVKSSDAFTFHGISGVNLASITALTYNGGATLTGTPTAPTATLGTNTTQIATTAFVNTSLGGSVNTILKKTSSGVLGNSNISDNGTIVSVNADSNFTGSATFQDIIIANNKLRLKGYTVSTLPTGVIGDTAYVTDATAPTYLGALTGGGSVVCPVFYNGAIWVSH